MIKKLPSRGLFLYMCIFPHIFHINERILLIYMRLGKLINNFLSKGTFEEHLFWSVISIAILTASFSATSAITGNKPISVTVFCSLELVFFIILGLITLKTKKYSANYMILCMAANILILPISFFYSGGFKSGRSFFFLGAIFLCTFIKNRAMRLISIALSIISSEIAFFIAWNNPELTTATSDSFYTKDFAISFFLTAVMICTFIIYLSNIYSNERKKKEVLQKELSYISKRDSLTSLFNRRYFSKYLDRMIWPNRRGFYLFLYDIDDFKKVNEENGHIFGDTVLCEIANVALALNRFKLGECSVRYGSQEFIQLFYAGSMNEALSRANQLRNAISGIHFEQRPKTRITISGGLVECQNSKFTTQFQMLNYAEELLLQAKNQGKNQICSKIH